MNFVRYYIRLLSVPLSLLVAYASLLIVWKIFGLPSPEEFIGIVKVWLDTYGLPVLFVSAILEGMLLIGSYFPGAFVIAISVVLARSVTEVTIVIAIGTAGLLVGHIFSYLLGKYGWYKLLIKFGMKKSVEQAQEKLLKKGPIAIFSTYWLPSLGAFTDTAAGIIRLPFRTFITYSVISSIFWDTLVGVIFYVLGDKAISTASGTSSDMIIFLILLVWIVWLLISDYRKKSAVSV